MRKRLIEKFTKSKEGSLGYTLTELLVVIAIIAIVVAIAIPSVIAISRALKFKRVNDHAKSIFLAAQQNLSEMRSDGGLKPLQEAGGVVLTGIAGFPDEFKTEYVYTTQGTTAFELILPAGSVDGTVRAEQIIIEYNPITGNVYSVFYSEEDESILGGYQSAAGLPRDDKAARKEMMLGYYDGSGLNSSQIELEKTQASVEFINGEEGIVRVLVPVPDDFFSNLNDYVEAMTINLTVTGEYSMVEAAENPPAENEAAPAISFPLTIKEAGTGMDGETCYVEYGNTIVVEYPIDSLVNQRSFANYSAGNQDSEALTELMDETVFTVLPGENITIQADVTVDTEVKVEVDSGILSGVNPMFEYLQPSGSGGYVLAVSNGRNLQNLNAIAPTIAKQVDSVVFTSDIYWNDTVSYYNNEYGVNGAVYTNAAAENPARALPYFVPIHNEGLFGTARFIFPTDESDGGLGSIIQGMLDSIFGGYSNKLTPTLTDEVDNVPDEETGITPAEEHANIQGDGHKVYNLKIDSTKYVVPNEGKFYATGGNQLIDYYFSGLFGYVNTPIDNLHVVNPIVKGHEMEDKETTVLGYENWWDILFGRPKPIKAYVQGNPATGALVGAGGFNTLVTNCSTYIDKDARGYIDAYLYHGNYDKDADQNWYGVSGEGAVGGLVGYAKSHRNVTGVLSNDEAVLAFSKCFAAVPVTGNMRATTDKNFGYSNGVGAFIGNSQLTNFYNCYASGDVIANNACVTAFTGAALQQGIFDIIQDLFGSDIGVQLLNNGRKSWGAGGFVGTSHGTRYTNCFATGNVNASAVSNKGGAGGFVGFMSIDETFKYGNESESTADNSTVAQRTVFTRCYSVGRAVSNNQIYENFSGANGRIVFSASQFGANLLGDYYRLYAPYYARNNGQTPEFEGEYIYRDSYFMSGYTSGANIQSGTCAESEDYATFENLTGNHTKVTDWMDAQIQAIKDIVLIDHWYSEDDTYKTEYFDRYPGGNNVKSLEEIYQDLYDWNQTQKGEAEPASRGWVRATSSTTHPYSMPNGSVYPFSKLVNLDYYGDWPSKPSAMGLAYYEAYATSPEKNQFFFDREHDDNASLHLNDGESVMVVKDGYAIFSANDAALTVTVNGVTDVLSASGERYTVSNNTYHVFYLSDKLMKALPADGEFYCTVTAKHATGNTYTMYFNPGVAISHVNPANGASAATKPDAAPKTIYVRSARQFKALATLDDFWGANYSYIQQLNIDATKYDNWGTAANAAKRQVGSIGDATKPFNASYSAGYTLEGDIAKQYKLTGFQFADNASGFFGVVGTSGSIENLIVECAAPSVGGTTVSDVAVLAGRNQGTISNVDVTITGAAALTSQDNAGLLAGYNSGTVRNCEVTAAAVTVNAKNGGGLIGSAVGTANAKAAVSGCKLTLSGNLTVTGANNAGGLIGHASHLTLSANEPLVTLTNMTANGAYAGGLAGYLENSEIKITDTANAVTVTVTSLKNTNGYAAGVLGGGKTVTLNGVDINAGTIEGKAAAGFLGTGTDIDATYCDVVINPNGRVIGTEKAAGVAGTIGAQSVFGYTPVTLNNVTVSASAGDAAGYAVEIAKEANVMNSNVTLGGTAKIQASGNAAGYACSVAGYVGNTTGSTVLSSVVGKGGISGNDAAGFACDITGQVSGAFVTPALDSSKYLGNSNNNLTVTGTTSAAGFALNVGADATVTNCYALNKLICADASGFVATNKGVINGCMANVTITGGYAFVKTNEGTVSRCYGWYGDGDETNATTTKAEVGGKCFSAYFADLNPVDKEGDIVTLYTADGKMQTMSATALQGAADVLANANNKWYTTGYNSYPYTAKPETMPSYLYPMLRDHFGDWITPPQYAYGVAYYETYEVTASAAEPAEAADVAEAAETTKPATTTVVKLHMVDLSDPAITEEKKAVSTYLVDNAGNVTTSATTVFNNEYTIKTSGYAVFGKKGANILESMSGETALFSYALNVNNKTITYEFFPLKTDSAENGVVSIGATAVSKTGATVQTYFADAINAGDTFIVRTPEQLAKIGAVSANFNQTHDIAVTDFTTASIASGKTYNGNKLKLSVSGQTQTWLSTVEGTVKDLNLAVSGGVNAPVFGTVGGTVTLSGLTVDTISANGALAETVTGTMKVPAISTAAVSGKLFGDSTGTIETGAITVTGETAQLFGKVGKVTVTGDIQAKANAGQLFGEVTGAVNTKAITVTGTAAQVFGNVTGGSVTVDGAINVTGAATQVFGTVGAPVEVKGNIATGAATQIFGEVGSGTVTVNGNISVDKTAAHTGKIFNAVMNTVTVTGNISLGEIGTNGQVFGDVTAAVTVSGGITTNGGAVNGQVFGAIDMGAGEAAQVGGITVGNVNNSLIKSITTAAKTDTAVAGSVSLGAVSTQAVGTPAQGETEAAPVNLFGAISGSGTVTVASVNTNDNAVTGNVFSTVGSTLDVTGGITTGTVTGNVFTEITGGTVTTGAINVASLNGKLAITVGGTLQGSAAGTAVNIGKNGTADLTQDLVGTVSGGLKNYAVKAADVSASVVGTLGENGAVTSVSITAASAGNVPVLVKSNGGNIVSCTVEVVSVEATGAAAPYGVMADKVNTNKKIENSFVKVGTLTIDGNTAQFGALVGTNAGSLTGNTVESNEADKSLALNVSGVNGKAPVIGGLVGQNTGTVSGGTVDVAITYTQSNTTDDQGNVTATDKGATIGGLVGENSGTIGVKDTVTNVKGAVNLTKLNDGQSRAYIIGGAVGNAKSGVINTSANVKVDAEWAGSPNVSGSATFGSSGITNNGPVGMFVGYAAGVTFTNCESTAANDTYQFIGEATVGTQTIEGKYWTTNKGVETLTAYDETEPYGEDDSYVSIEDESVSLNKASSSVNKVSTVFENCTFMLGSTQRTQTLGAKDFYYTQGEPQWQKAFSSGEALKVSFESAGNQKFSVNEGNSQALTDTTLYYKTGTSYVRAYWKCDYKAGSWFLDPDTYTFTLCDANGNALTTAKEGTYERVWEGYNRVTKYYAEFELHSIKEPALSAAYYLVVTDDGLAVDKNGNTSAIVKEFLQKDDFFTYVYSCTDMKLDGLTVTAINSSAQSYGATDAIKYTVGSLSAGDQKNFMLYPLTVNDQAYQLLTFSWDTDAYRDQYVTYSPMDNTKAISEETIPADNGGETGNNT